MSLLTQDLPPGPVITDGAWGTQLQTLGLGAGECPDAWNLTHADRVETVARAYVEAGSQVIQPTKRNCAPFLKSRQARWPRRESTPC
jgi:methionine synthase I (cobalamin-dependent)